MKKFLFSILMATLLMIGFVGESADASSKATAKSGVYVTTLNTNVRADAGSVHRTVFTLKKGTRVNLTHQKYYGSQLWYKVKINGKKGYVLSSLVKKSTGIAVTSTTPAKSSSGVVKTALNLRGIPYRFGGTTTGQYNQSSKIKSPRPGDLVFFHNTYRQGISHVGIYVGNNKFVHAGGKRSEVVSLSSPYWKSKFNSFRRI